MVMFTMLMAVAMTTVEGSNNPVGAYGVLQERGVGSLSIGQRPEVVLLSILV